MMFFPKLEPSKLIGQTLNLAAAFLGVAMVTIGGAVFTGPLYRDGSKVFMLHTEMDPDGQTARLRFVDIGENATANVLDFAQREEVYCARIESDAKLIEALRDQMKEYVESQRAANVRNRDHIQSLVDGMETANNLANARYAEIVDLRERLKAAAGALQHYTDLVGPLDHDANRPNPAQLQLIENAEPAPPPPPVVEAGPQLAETGESSHVPEVRSVLVSDDYAFRRLMFLTRGDGSRR